MTTSEKIISNAVDLFNKEGYGNVSLRHIADRCDISLGNLTYHFPDKEKLMTAIYELMFEEMEGVIVPSSEFKLRDFQNMLKHFYAFQEKYRFFFLELVHILRSYPSLAERHRETVAKRKSEGLGLIYYFVGKGLMISEPVPGCYENLVQAIWIVNTFWIAQLRVITGADHLRYKHQATEVVWAMMLPYLSKAGLDEYKNLRDI